MRVYAYDRMHRGIEVRGETVEEVVEWLRVYHCDPQYRITPVIPMGGRELGERLQAILRAQ